MHRNPLVSFSVALLLGIASSLPAQAGGAYDHDRARQALEAGEILPLRAILDRVERDTPGQIMEVELDRKDGRWIYEIKVLRTGGSLTKLKVDAADGAVLGSEARGAKGERRPGGNP
jgi:uncharacterized membrane protein YkoI